MTAPVAPLAPGDAAPPISNSVCCRARLCDCAKASHIAARALSNDFAQSTSSVVCHHWADTDEAMTRSVVGFSVV